jgi:hypothetical protein
MGWLAAGATLVLMGFRVSSLPLRKLGSGLLVATGIKVVLTDSMSVGMMGKVVIFVLIGVVFLGIALTYGRKQTQHK